MPWNSDFGCSKIDFLVSRAVIASRIAAVDKHCVGYFMFWLSSAILIDLDDIASLAATRHDVSLSGSILYGLKMNWCGRIQLEESRATLGFLMCNKAYLYSLLTHYVGTPRDSAVVVNWETHKTLYSLAFLSHYISYCFILFHIFSNVA